MRVLLPLYWLFLGCLADREIYNPFGELVHVARARGSTLAHAYQYGATDRSLQRRSGMLPVKLSHYRIAPELAFDEHRQAGRRDHEIVDRAGGRIQFGANRHPT
jgi:hypothetical protein